MKSRIILVAIAVAILLTGGAVVATTGPLELDTTAHMLPGETATYEVTYNGDNVTDSADVSTSDEDNLSVEGNQLVASGDAPQQRYNVTAEYDGWIVTEEVSVAEVSVANFESLPPIWRFTATMQDTNMQLLIIATFCGVAGARIATSFAGIAMAQLVFAIGWLAGYVDTGIALVGLFAALFIGFNVAANVDYSVRR